MEKPSAEPSPGQQNRENLGKSQIRSDGFGIRPSGFRPSGNAHPPVGSFPRAPVFGFYISARADSIPPERI